MLHSKCQVELLSSEFVLHNVFKIIYWRDLENGTEFIAVIGLVDVKGH
jgi:hypothetical protein